MEFTLVAWPTYAHYTSSIASLLHGFCGLIALLFEGHHFIGVYGLAMGAFMLAIEFGHVFKWMDEGTKAHDLLMEVFQLKKGSVRGAAYVALSLMPWYEGDGWTELAALFSACGGALYGVAYFQYARHADATYMSIPAQSSLPGVAVQQQANTVGPGGANV